MLRTIHPGRRNLAWPLTPLLMTTAGVTTVRRYVGQRDTYSAVVGGGAAPPIVTGVLELLASAKVGGDMEKVYVDGSAVEITLKGAVVVTVTGLAEVCWRVKTLEIGKTAIIDEGAA